MLKRFFSAVLISSCLFTLSAEATDIRIALVEGQNTAALNSETTFRLRNLLSGEETVLPKGKYFAHVKEGQLQLEQQGFGQAVELLVDKGQSLPKVNGRSYDGKLVIKLVENKLLITNEVDLELLVSRILPRKTMPIWPDEAIKAQAVAARTYLLHQKQQGAERGYAIKNTDKEAPYYGLGQRTEKQAITRLVKATAGEYLVDKNGEPIYALTTSSSGGKTESGFEALGKAYSYLQSVEDYDQDSPEYKWEFRISPEYVEGLLAQNGYYLGKLANVRLSSIKEPGGDRTATGRVKYMIFGGTIGTAKLTGQRAAELFNLNSNYFDVETGTPVPEKIELPITNTYGMEIGKKEVPIKVKEEEPKIWSEYLKSYHVLTGGKAEKLIFRGQGKGSGLGLSAWGARGLANGTELKNYAEILAHYYPGTQLVKMK